LCLLQLIDAGKSRAEIQEATDQILGVAGCSLDIEAGEVLVLMGLSGSGKSTLLRGINGLNPVVRGEVAGKSKHEILSKVDEQLSLVGLSDWAEKQVQELSGGMQQRVGLARAFATQAPILLMDEPYSALDPLIRSRLQDELIDLQTRLKRTIVFVSHDLDEAIKVGSRIAIMEGGRIIQIGTAQEILNNPANQYVEDFVGHMNPLAVLKAEDAMTPLSRRKPKHANALTIDCNASMTEVIAKQLTSDMPLYVLKNQQTVGSIDKEDVHKALINHPQ